MSSDEVIKTVAKNLKYYFEVKRLEDGFDMSGSSKLILDRPRLKPRPILLQYGLHDRSLKHYFSDPDIRVKLTQMKPRPMSSTLPRERYVKHKLEKNMAKHNFLFSGPELPPVLEEKSSCKKSRSSKSKCQFKSSLPECYYIYGPPKGRITKPELTGFGVPLKSNKKKALKTGWPVLRTVPTTYISRGEAERLVNVATKLLVATESLDYAPRPASCRQAAPHSFESPGGGRPSTAKYTWDLNGRKVRQDETKVYDDHYLARNRIRSHDPGRRSPTPSEGTSTTHISQITHSTHTSRSSDDRYIDHSRPKTTKQRHRTQGSSRTVINVPPTAVQDEVSVVGGTQTLDEIGTQTDRRIYQQYKPEEDEVRNGPWGEYQIYVRTGNRIGASGKADVKLTLYGDKGCSKEFVLKESKRNKIKFQKGKEDLFIVACHHVGKLRKIKIGHDYPELCYAWFLEGVSVYDMESKRIYEFPCDQWLSGQDGDRRTYRTLQCDRDRAFIDALKSEENLLDLQNETSDESEHSPAQNNINRPPEKNNTSMQVNLSQSESRSQPKHRQQRQQQQQQEQQHQQQEDESESSSGSSYTGSNSDSDSYSDSDRSDEAVVEENDKDAKDGQTEKDGFYDNSKPKGPTFTFRSVNPNKNAERKRAEGQSSVSEDVIKHVQEDFMAGYKAGIEAANKEKHQHEKHEREQERTILNGQTIHDAAKNGNLERIKQLLEHYPELMDAKDENGWTALHLATSTGQINAVKWLTTSGVNLDVETPTGYTPMHIAAMNGHVSVMMVLAAMGASITCETVDKQTALHLAARGGYLSCVKWLIANHARVDSEDNFGRTPLYLAEEYEQSTVADFLRACERELANPNSSFALLYGQSRPSTRQLEAIEEEQANLIKDQGWMEDKEETKKVQRANSPDLQEKKKIYEEQHIKMAERGVSFLDSIRQDIDED